jgi:hypothetical protein
MGSGVMMFIPSFLKVGSGILNLMGKGFTDRQREHGLISLLSVYIQNKERRLKIT